MLKTSRNPERFSSCGSVWGASCSCHRNDVPMRPSPSRAQGFIQRLEYVSSNSRRPLGVPTKMRTFFSHGKLATRSIEGGIKLNSSIPIGLSRLPLYTGNYEPPKHAENRSSGASHRSGLSSAHPWKASEPLGATPSREATLLAADCGRILRRGIGGVCHRHRERSLNPSTMWATCRTCLG